MKNTKLYRLTADDETAANSLAHVIEREYEIAGHVNRKANGNWYVALTLTKPQLIAIRLSYDYYIHLVEEVS